MTPSCRFFRFIPIFLILVPFGAGATPVNVEHLRLWQAPDHTRLVFDLSGPLEHRLFLLKDPDRIVIDLDNAVIPKPLPAIDTGGRILAGVRSGERGPNDVRIVLDLKLATQPRTFVLKPYGEYGHRLVIDLYDAKAAEEEARLDARPAAPVSQDLIIAIDAGHGGEDPGAIGRRYRTREKDVVLAIARELARLIAAEPGMKPVLIRDGDYYIGLRERIKKARRHNADVLISIHADSIPGRHARGSSVYALSERGATSEAAKVLADKENAADYVGGASLNDKDDLLLKVLVDMTQTATISDSLDLGGDVLGALRAIGPLHSNNVSQAGFMVLKSPHIPSILVETAFISNPEEERKLRNPAFQRRMAQSIFAGLKRASPRLLARRGLPSGTPVAGSLSPAAPPSAREYVVRRGDTLSSIARRHEIHIDALRFLNDLQGNDLPVGLKLRIPARAGDG